MRLNPPTQVGAGRSRALSPELLVNVYAELAPSAARSNVVIHGRPGSKVFADIGTDKIRGIHLTESDGKLYVVVGNSLYNIDESGNATQLGTIGSSGRVGMADSETQLCIIAGNNGYTYSPAQGFQAITDPSFPGAGSITYLDGYFIFTNRQNGQKDQFFISDLLDGNSYDALDFATAERYPDNLVRVFADHSQLLLFGTNSIEIWFNASNPDFPFARAQGSVIDQGLGAKYSVCKVDESVIWLDNEGIVRRLQGNTPLRISTHPIEYYISRGDAESAWAWSYSIEGHQFYILTIPAVDRSQSAATFQYDAATQLWCQLKTYEADFYKIGFYARAFGKHIVGDSETGKLYELSFDYFKDVDTHIIAELHFPQIFNDSKRFIVHSFELDMEVGEAGQTKVTTYSLSDFEEKETDQSDAIYDMAVADDYTVAVGQDGMIIKSATDGQTWNAKTSGFNTTDINGVARNGSELVAVGDGSTRAISADNGDTWEATTDVFAVEFESDGVDFSSVVSVCRGFGFNNDGTKIYIVDRSGQVIYQYSMSTAYDVTMMTYDSISFDVSGQIQYPRNLQWKPDGSRFWISSEDEVLYEYDVSTAFNVSTASYNDVSYDMDPDITSNDMFCASPDGRYIYSAGSSGLVKQIECSTPWDLSTASDVVVVELVASNASWRGVTFKPDGKRMFLQRSTEDIYQIDLTVAWDLSTAVYGGVDYDPDPYISAGFGVLFSAAGTRMFICSSSDDFIVQYSVAPPYELLSTDIIYSCVAHGNGAYIAATEEGFLLRSTDGESFSFLSSPFGGTAINAIAYAVGKWVAVGASGKMAYSLDGIHWFLYTSPFGTTPVNGIAYGNGRWIAAANTSQIAILKGGFTWEIVAVPFDTDDVLDVAYSNGIWTIVGEDAHIALSTDNGDTWTAVGSDLPSTREIRSVGMTDTFILAGADLGDLTKAEIIGNTSDYSVPDPKVMLRESPDTITVGAVQPTRSTGKKGEWSQRVIWRRRGEYRTYSPIITISDPIRRAVFQAFAEVEPCDR